MTKWLASVQSLDEAQTLLNNLPDILDVKNPSQGALGALPVDQVSEIVALVNEQCMTSATVGDLPMDAELVSTALTAMANSNVDYLKLGLFPDPALQTCLTTLEKTLSRLSTPVIAVLFADQMPDIDVLNLIKQVGFAGVMIDTADKNGQHLLDYWSEKQLAGFIQLARQNELLCGLAGALRCEDIIRLKLLQADYLGFRSALCQKRQRKDAIDLSLVQHVQNAIYANA